MYMLSAVFFTIFTATGVVSSAFMIPRASALYTTPKAPAPNCLPKIYYAYQICSYSFYLYLMYKDFVYMNARSAGTASPI